MTFGKSISLLYARSISLEVVCWDLCFWCANRSEQTLNMCRDVRCRHDTSVGERSSRILSHISNGSLLKLCANCVLFMSITVPTLTLWQ